MSERARALRVLAGFHRGVAALFDASAAAVTAAEAMNGLARELAAADARDVAAHPDLSYLDLQLDGYYDPRGEA